MKQTPEEQAMHERLQASKFSGDGFLGDDHRPLNEIIASDLHTLRELEVPLHRLVVALRDAYTQARAAFGGDVQVNPSVTAFAHESMGRIPSPFPGDGVFEKGDVVLTHTPTGNQLVLTALGIHMIEKHNFFQGRGSRYRIDPAQAVQFLL